MNRATPMPNLRAGFDWTAETCGLPYAGLVETVIARAGE